MIFLVTKKLCRFRERNDNNRNAAAVEFSFENLDLAEVLLARQSGQVPKENEQSVVLEIIVYRDCAAKKITKI